MATLINAENNEEIGHISHQEFERIVNILEDEGQEVDSEFYIDDETIDLLENSGIKASTIDMLHEALGEDDSIQVTYEED